ncbi:AAA domain containing protein [uncultured Caudovirales phage]|uniref:AAA domain containing protein n=2 Tax=root TaxID=1 RepID=A0A6J5P299_9CAUD|nr:AAA domain containing protein [uncultured Caudovirales phage]CAB4171263.1 AAA domain containing protein [uncultured Caudovirales phage]CAB4177230.1 AAA domain containing protein [uncultured Caudovirales phage]CAB4182829.1 AAA domain containing protein [uncultured Caudovirales phage]CAB4187526.1 AAA domain containing protein [uncultured Caudovirales phage]
MAEINGPEKHTGPFQALVFGRFKTGKTAGAATFPRPNIIDFDSGLNTVRSKWWQDANPNHKIIYETFTEKNKTPHGVVKVPNAFDDACKWFDEWMKPDKVNQFDTWVVDSGTSLSIAAANKAIYLMDGGRMPGIKSETLKNALTHGLVVPKMQDFGAERSMMEQFIDMMLSSKKNFILLAHEKEVFKDDGTLDSIVPMLTGQSVEKIPLKFDEVYRLVVKPAGPIMKRTLMTQANSLNRVGTRLGLPDGTEWSWQAISKALGITE